MNHCETRHYHFKVAEHGEGRKSIAFEPQVGDLSILENVIFGLDLPDEMPYERAQKIADLLNDNIESVSYTLLPKDADPKYRIWRVNEAPMKSPSN